VAVKFHILYHYLAQIVAGRKLFLFNFVYQFPHLWDYSSQFDIFT